MKRLGFPFILTILASYALSPGHAAVVHKWVDDKGITHYSDEAPELPSTPVTLLEIPTVDSAAVDSKDEYYSIANQWQRMHRERIELERIRLEAARQRTADQPPPPQVVYIDDSQEKQYLASFPVLLKRKGNRHYHRSYRHRFNGIGYKIDKLRRQHRASAGLGAYRHFD